MEKDKENLTNFLKQLDNHNMSQTKDYTKHRHPYLSLTAEMKDMTLNGSHNT